MHLHFYVKMQLAEAVVQMHSSKMVFLKISQMSQKNTCAKFSFLIFFFKKETFEQVLSPKFWESFKNTFLKENLRRLLLHLQKRLWWTRFSRCPYLELFGSAFARIRTEYGKKLRISPYSVRMRENTDQNNSEYGHFSRSESLGKC